MMTIQKQTHSCRGLTLIETIITIAIVSMIMVGFTALFARLWHVYGFTMETGIATQIAAHGIDDAVQYIRKAQASENGSFPIVSAKPNEFIFYSDFDNDGVVERVRYFGDVQQFKVGIIEPDTSTVPANYDDTTESIKTLSQYVANSIVQGTSECTQYHLSSKINGTSSNPFTSIGMARGVPSAGEYFFDINGQQFSTQVTTTGWVLVAAGNRSTNESKYNKTSSLSYDSDRILKATALSVLEDITHVRIEATNQSWWDDDLPHDVYTDDLSIISRLKNFETLTYNQATSAVWKQVSDDTTGTSMTDRMIATSDTDPDHSDGCVSSALNKHLFFACGNDSGMIWTHKQGPTGKLQKEEVVRDNHDNDLNLYVRAPADPTVFYIIATKQPDGSFLGDNNITYTEQELTSQNALCTASNGSAPTNRPIFEYYDDFSELFDTLPNNTGSGVNDNKVFDYEDVQPTKLEPSSPGESVDVSKIKMVRILLHINPKPNQAPENIILESYVNIRNLSPYDHL